MVYEAGDDDICVLGVASGIAGCNDLEAAEAGRLYVAKPVGCSTYHVVGLAPDGVTRLTSETEQIPVEQNVWSASLAAVAHGLSSDSSGFEVRLPLNEFAKQNVACR